MIAAPLARPAAVVLILLRSSSSGGVSFLDMFWNGGFLWLVLNSVAGCYSAKFWLVNSTRTSLPDLYLDFDNLIRLIFIALVIGMLACCAPMALPLPQFPFFGHVPSFRREHARVSGDAPV